MYLISNLKIFKCFSSRREERKYTNNNDTFSSMFSDELINSDLVKKPSVTFKNNTQMEGMYSSFSERSSLGILEIDNMSGN